jgi:hypothetical protein
MPDPQGMILEDTACRHCSYNLRGLGQHGRCPECGTPMEVSLHGDWLRHADPAWVWKLSRGMRLALWGLLAYFIMGAIGKAVGAELHEPMLGIGIAMLGASIGLYGAWLLTEPDPSGIDEDCQFNARKLARVGLMVGIIVGVIALLPAMLWLSTPTLLVHRMSVLLLVLCSDLIFLAGEVARLLYIERLAARIPDPMLCRWSRILRWGFGPSVAVSMITQTCRIILYPGGLKTSAGAIALDTVLSVISLPAMGFPLMYLILLFRFESRLRVQARAAEIVWLAGLAVAHALESGHSTPNQPPPLPPMLPTPPLGAGAPNAPRRPDYYRGLGGKSLRDFWKLLQ